MLSSPYDACVLCGRECGANRTAGKTGFCGETAVLRIASASIHRGEEPPITGKGGSGTIFFTGCTLHCRFCQNWQISREGMGRAVDADGFVAVCLDLEARGAENINLVTGTQFIPSIARGLELAREQGLAIPALWNSSGYDKAESIALVAPWLDVYLPDLKTLDSGLARNYFNAPDYPAHAQKSILYMAGRHPLVMKDGVMKSGLMVRHLVLPGMLENTREVLRWFADHLAGRALLSLMMQYTPIPDAERSAGTGPADRGGAVSRGQGACATAARTGAGSAGPAPLPARYVDQKEYDAVLAMLDEFGIEDGFYQELEPDDEWLPDFRRTNPFPSKLSVPTWHWKTGFVPAS